MGSVSRGIRAGRPGAVGPPACAGGGARGGELVRRSKLRRTTPSPLPAICSHHPSCRRHVLPWRARAAIPRSHLPRRRVAPLPPTFRPAARRYAEALAHFEHAERIEPGFYPKNLLLTAQALARLGRADEAKAALAKCLAATPKSPEDEATLEEARKLKL